MRGVPDRALRREYRPPHHASIAGNGPIRSVLFVYVLKCAIHYHHYTMARQMLSQDRKLVNTFLNESPSSLMVGCCRARRTASATDGASSPTLDHTHPCEAVS